MCYLRRLGHNETHRRRWRRRVLLQLDVAFDGDVDEFVLQRRLHEARSLLTKVQYRLEYVDLGIHTCPHVTHQTFKTPACWCMLLRPYHNPQTYTLSPILFLLHPSPPTVPILTLPISPIHLPSPYLLSYRLSLFLFLPSLECALGHLKTLPSCNYVCLLHNVKCAPCTTLCSYNFFSFFSFPLNPQKQQQHQQHHQQQQ